MSKVINLKYVDTFYFIYLVFHKIFMSLKSLYIDVYNYVFYLNKDKKHVMMRYPNILYYSLHLDVVTILLINGPNLLKFGNKGLCYFTSISMVTSIFQTFLVAPLSTSILQFRSLYHKTLF